MNKTVIIFGAFGALGRGVVQKLLKKDYDKFYLFDLNAEEQEFSDQRVIRINNSDLSDEKNVKKAFSNIKKEREERFYLFSTVGGFLGGTEVKDSASEDLDKMYNMNTKSNYLIGKYFTLLAADGGAACLVTPAFRQGC